MTHIVFVYGSLMRGFGNHRLLEGSQFLGEAVVPNLSIYSLGAFPGVKEGTDNVQGEMYEVDDGTLARLDRLEGHPNFYERRETRAFNENMNSTLPCMFYHYQGRVRDEDYIPSGSWREHATENTSFGLRC